MWASVATPNERRVSAAENERAAWTETVLIISNADTCRAAVRSSARLCEKSSGLASAEIESAATKETP